MPFPPSPTYPKAIDTNYTLFLVYNTTESRLCRDNAAWAEEMQILPVAADQDEIWPDNGFANIDGELFYYDSVEKNDDGKVYKLKGCARNLTGRTKFNPKGTWVRGFVVAEHHNQLVEAVLKLENFVGFNFDPRQETLDWRIRHLQGLNTIPDDYNCPDVSFFFTIVENNPETGIIAEYLIQIPAEGIVTTFRLDFGDGTFTTTALEGTHRYAINAVIDPVLTVSNDKCQMIVTPVERENPSEPQSPDDDEFTIPFPTFNDIPDFTFVPCEIPEQDLNLPPLVTVCSEGSNIDIGDFNLPSTILIEGPYINMVSHVTIEGGFTLPSHIFVDMPPTVVIDPPIPPTIVIVTSSDVQNLSLNMDNMPKLEVDWGSGPPPIQVELAFSKPVSEPKLFAQSVPNEFGDEFADLFAAQEHISVEYEAVGIPSKILIEAPSSLPKLEIDTTPLKDLRIAVDDPKIPSSIQVFGPENPIPTDIRIHGPATPLPAQIEVINKNIPSQMELVASPDLPRKIELEHDLPRKIVVELPTPIPDKIILDASGLPKSIPVTGIPDAIELLPPPGGIPLLMPEKMPQMELAYNGPPIEVKVTLDQLLGGGENSEGRPCFMLVPCGK
jgi:hypothetical protein